jgi:hypothetical protein
MDLTNIDIPDIKDDSGETRTRPEFVTGNYPVRILSAEGFTETSAGMKVDFTFKLEVIDGPYRGAWMWLNLTPIDDSAEDHDRLVKHQKRWGSLKRATGLLNPAATDEFVGKELLAYCFVPESDDPTRKPKAYPCGFSNDMKTAADWAKPSVQTASPGAAAASAVPDSVRAAMERAAKEDEPGF